MGFGGISIWQLLIVLAIIILIFGTKKLKSLGGDLGGAVKGFKKAMNDDQAAQETEETKKIDQNDADFQESQTAEKKEEQKTDK